MRRMLRMLAVAFMCGSVALMGGCASEEDGASISDSSSVPRDLWGAETLRFFGGVEEGEEWARENGLLTQAEAAAALGEFSTLSPLAGYNCLLRLTLPPDVSWDASTFFDLHNGTDEPTDESMTDVVTRVSECTITSLDPKATAEVYAYLEGLTLTQPWPPAEGRYAPAPIGVAVFAWELNGGGREIDRLVVVNTGDSLVGIVANRTDVETKDDNLTREQVDNLVEAAVDKLAAERASTE